MSCNIIRLDNDQIEELLKIRPDIRIFKRFGGYATLATDFHLPYTYARGLEKLLKIHDLSMARYITNVRRALLNEHKDAPQNLLAWIIKDIEKHTSKGEIKIGDRRLTLKEKEFLMNEAESTPWESFQDEFDYLFTWQLTEADIALAPLRADSMMDSARLNVKKG